MHKVLRDHNIQPKPPKPIVINPKPIVIQPQDNIKVDESSDYQPNNNPKDIKKFDKEN